MRENTMISSDIWMGDPVYTNQWLKIKAMILSCKLTLVLLSVRNPYKTLYYTIFHFDVSKSGISCMGRERKKVIQIIQSSFQFSVNIN